MFAQARAAAAGPAPVAAFANAGSIESHTNLRVGPGAQHGVITVLAPGEIVQILNIAGGWIQVRRAKDWSQGGWIPGDQVRRLQPMNVPMVAQAAATAPSQPQPARRPAATSALPSAVAPPAPAHPAPESPRSVAKTAAPAAPSPGRLLLQVVVPQATLYAEPDVLAPIVARVEIGTELEADLRSGNWYHVRRTTGGDAWIQDEKTSTGTTLAVAPFPSDRRLAYEEARAVDPPAVTRARPQGVPLEPANSSSEST